MTVVLAFSLSLIVATVPVQVSRRAPEGAQKATVSAAIALRAGAQAYDFTGQVQCRHAPQASIYGTNAEMWSVEHNESGKGLRLTVWKPRDGGDVMLNLEMSAGGKESRVNTVKGGQQSTASGSGTVTFAPEGKGGIFTINATADGGTKISGTIKCEAFTPLIAEGGN